MTAKPLEVSLKATSAILMNAETGVILYEKESRKKAYPASVTKIATLLYFLENQTLPLDQSLKVSAEALKMQTKLQTLEPYRLIPDGSTMNLQKGEILSVEALLHGLMLVSGNDAANVLAENHSGSIDRFIENMNVYLRQIVGCTQTQFKNPHGIHHEEHYTSAYDLALMAKRALQIPLFREIVKKSVYHCAKTNKRAAWDELEGASVQDFEMIDLGHEYAVIDQNTEHSDEEKMQAKLRLREEDALRKERSHNLRQMLRAHLLMEQDIDYIVQEGKIVIIDENTGRPQPGRRFSDGLHQAIEAKENVAIQGETQTYATITLQNYFRLYERLSGMTGTAMTEANEFKEIYKLDVLEIPTYRKCQRKDFDDEIYMTEREKYNAILKDIKEIHALGRPILIGTESVEVSEKLSRILKQNRLEHTILNAKNHASEAEVIAEAGKKGAITLATNMAGRGTDIKLKEGVRELGGLYVLGTTRHPSRRIDRQLRGRSGRLGDPGSSKFYISFEDDLMRLFASPRMAALLQRFRPPEGEPISAKVLNKSIETAQKRIEQRNYTIRKHTLEYDDVMNKQRQEVYSFRSSLLHAENPLEMALQVLEDAALHFTNQIPDTKESLQALSAHFPIHFSSLETTPAEERGEGAAKLLCSHFEKKMVHQRQVLAQNRPEITDAEKGQAVLQEVLRNVMIRRLDHMWQDHLLSIDHLRADVHMRTVGQKDPLLEFKHESFALFERFSIDLRLEIGRDLFRFEMAAPSAPMQLQEQLALLQKKRASLAKEGA